MRQPEKVLITAFVALAMCAGGIRCSEEDNGVNIAMDFGRYMALYSGDEPYPMESEELYEEGQQKACAMDLDAQEMERKLEDPRVLLDFIHSLWEGCEQMDTENPLPPLDIKEVQRELKPLEKSAVGSGEESRAKKKRKDAEDQEGEAQPKNKDGAKGAGKEKEKIDATQEMEENGLSILERIIKANGKELQSLYISYKEDLDNESHCRPGSLEWICTLKAVLEKALKELEGSSGEAENEKETRAVSELIKKAIEAYEKELKDRKTFLTHAVERWIPWYIEALNTLLVDKEKTMKAIRGDRWARKNGGTENSENSESTSRTSRTLITMLRKNLSDVAEGRKMEGLGGSPTLAERVCESRGHSSLVGKWDIYEGQLPQHVQNTFFFIVTAALRYDEKNRHDPSGEKQKSGSALFSAFLRRLSREKERVDKIEGQMRLQNQNKIPLLRYVALSKREELELIEDIYRHVLEHMERDPHSKEKLMKTESIESYLKREESKENGDLPRIFKILHRVMEDSGHSAKVKEDTGVDLSERVKQSEHKSNYRYNVATAWLQSLSQKLCAIQTNLYFELHGDIERKKKKQKASNTNSNKTGCAADTSIGKQKHKNLHKDKKSQA